MMIMQPYDAKNNPVAPTNTERQLFRIEQVGNRTQVSLAPFYDTYKRQVDSYLNWSIKYSIYKRWLVEQFHQLMEELERHKLDAARIYTEWKSRIEELIKAQKLRIEEAKNRLKRIELKNSRLMNQSDIDKDAILLSQMDKKEENYNDQRANDMKDAAMEDEVGISVQEGGLFLERLILLKNQLNGEHTQKKLKIERNYDNIYKCLAVVNKYVEDTDKEHHSYILRPNQEQATAGLNQNLSHFQQSFQLIFETAKSCFEHLLELQEADQDIILHMEILRLNIAKTVAKAEAPYLIATWKDLKEEFDDELIRLTNFRNMDRNQHLQLCVQKTFKKLEKIRKGFASLDVRTETNTATVGRHFEQSEHHRALTSTVTFSYLSGLTFVKNIPNLEFKPKLDPYRYIACKKTMDQEHFIEEIRKEIKDIEELLNEENVLNEKIGICQRQLKQLENFKQSHINVFNNEINLIQSDIEAAVQKIQGDPLNQLSLESYSLFPLLGALMSRMTVRKSGMCTGSVGQPHARTAVYVEDVLRVFARDILQATVQQNSIFVGFEKRVKITNRYPIATLGQILVHPELLGAFRKAQGLRATVAQGVLENDISFSIALTIDKISEIILFDLQSHSINEELKTYALEQLKKKNKNFEYAKLGYFAVNQLQMTQELQKEATQFRQLEG